ncbi:unnamed protein product, partial [Iphiclides podalirius]
MERKRGNEVISFDNYAMIAGYLKGPLRWTVRDNGHELGANTVCGYYETSADERSELYPLAGDISEKHSSR